MPGQYSLLWKATDKLLTTDGLQHDDSPLIIRDRANLGVCSKEHAAHVLLLSLFDVLIMRALGGLGS